MRKIITAALCLGLAACASEPPAPIVQIVRVPSAEPYRYIHWAPTCPPAIVKEIRHHNYVHSQVKKAEAEALAKVETENKH